MPEPDEPDVTLGETASSETTGGPFAPGDTGLTGLEVPRARHDAGGPAPSEVEPTDNSAGTPVDMERVEAVEDTGR